MRFIGIDPSTKTGFVALDEHGQIMREKEITGIGDVDPKRMRTLIVDLMAHIQKDDVIVIEGYAHNAKGRALQFQYGLGEGIRMALNARKINYIEVAPNALKKFVGVTGWTGEKGSKRRLSGPEKKRAVKAAVKEHFNYSHKSDNVIDAYVLAQIARDVYYTKQSPLTKEYGISYQNEVIDTILKGAN
jgi:crossover junction endodeoxyribonuclease RuvC